MKDLSALEIKHHIQNAANSFVQMNNRLRNEDEEEEYNYNNI